MIQQEFKAGEWVPQLPRVTGASFVCNMCCEKMHLQTVDGCVIGDCPDHLTIVIRDGKVVSTVTKGLRS